MQGIHKDEGTKTKCNSYVIGKSQQGVEGELDIWTYLGDLPRQLGKNGLCGHVTRR